MPFSKSITGRGLHVYNFTTWQKLKMARKYILHLRPEKKLLISIHTPLQFKYFHEIKLLLLFTVGHIPMEISRLSGSVLSKTYKPSPIPKGGLNIPLKITFQHSDESILDKIKYFVTENYEEGKIR